MTGALIARTEVGEKVFSALQVNSTLLNYSTMFARLICFMLRSVRENHAWMEKYPLDYEQLQAIETLWDAVEGGGSDQAVIEAIHDLALRLFCKERSKVQDGDFACPVYRFLIVVSLTKGGGFVGVLDITNIIAKLQWTCRAVIYEELLRRMANGQAESEAWGELCIFIRQDRYTAFNSLRQAMHLAAAIVYGTSSMPQITWLDEENLRLSIHGKPLGLDRLRDFVQSRLQAAKDQFDREVMFGIRMEEFGFTSADVVDQLSNRTVGYSFVDSPENGFKACRDKLIKAVMEDPLIVSFFVKRVTRGRIEWNKDGCITWLKRTKQFLSTMMTVMHIVYGQPARGAELETVLIRNTKHGMRGIYWCNGRVMIMIGYTKPRSTNGKGKMIARFLPKAVGDLLVKYLAIVRPMEALIAEEIELQGFERYATNLFVDHEKAWTADNLSRMFKSQTNKWGEVSMGFQEYRQVATAFMSKHLKQHDMDEEGDDVLDMQAGHSTHTASLRYAVSTSDADELPSDLLYAYLKASESWQALFGFDKVGVKAGKVPRTVREEGTVQNEKVLEMLVELRQAMEGRFRELNRPQLTGGTAPTVRKTDTEEAVRVEVSGESIKALRKFRGDERATFKSVEQGRALQLIIDGKTDVLAILPTGGGKSMLFFLPTLMEREMTTVVIVPLIAVMHDLRSRCIEAGISCAVWDPKNPLRVNTNLLFVAVEHAVEARFQDHLQILHGTGRLKRMVMDEAHVALTHRSFRPGMRKLVSVLRCVPVPAVLLTATLPIFMESQLRTAMACERWQVVRAETSRREIGYEVVEVNEEEDELDIEIGFRVKAEMRKWVHGNERGIIYCLQKDWAEELKVFMNGELGEDICEVYHADMDKDQRAAVYLEWEQGTIKILVATSALGLGIDYSYVRFVIHQGQSRSLVDFIQESGRAGRDGKEARSVIFTADSIRKSCEWIEKKEAEWVEETSGGWKGMKEWVANKDICRRMLLGEYVDGKGVNCIGLKDCVWCDVCQAQMEGEAEAAEEDEGDTVSEEVMMNVVRADGERRTRVDMAMEIQEMMSTLKIRCVLCWLNRTSANHAIWDCRFTHGKCLRCLDPKHKLGQCRKIYYERGGCCFKCGLPQRLGGEHIHGDIASAECEEGYEDKMVPLGWYLWRDKRWRRRLATHFRAEWNEEEFRMWLGKMDEGEVTNGVRVMLWIWYEKEGKM